MSTKTPILLLEGLRLIIPPPQTCNSYSISILMANRKAYTACCFLMGSLLYQRGEIFRWCLTLLGLSSTTLFLFLFLSICSLSLNASTVLSATQTSVDWSGEVSALQPCNPSVKWAYWLLCSIVHVSSKWASVVQSSPTFSLRSSLPFPASLLPSSSSSSWCYIMSGCQGQPDSHIRDYH